MTHTLVVCKPKLPDQYLTQRVDLKRQLDQMNSGEVMYFPVFELVPDLNAMALIRPWIDNATEKANRLIVFVSPSVLEIAVTNLGQWPANVYCAVMGRQSAKLASDLGIPEDKIIAPTGEHDLETEDSDGLAHLLAAKFGAGSCSVMVCKGPRGRVEFPKKLEEMNHDVTVLECYDRKVIDQSDSQCDALFSRMNRAVLWITSSETVEALDSQLKQKSDSQLNALKQTATVLTTHPRITAKCRELGYVHVVQIATGIQSVNSWLKSNKKSMENNNQTNTATPTSKSQPAAAALSTPSAASSAQPTGQWLGKAAFFISVVSFVLILLIAFAGKNQIEKTRMAFGERIQKESTTLDLVKEEINKSSDLAKDLKTRFDLLELAQKEEASQRASLEEVYNSLLASRTEVSLSEVEQLISIAKRQLYLLGNVKGASIALSQAIDLLEGTEKPSLLNLRTALEKDLSEIKALPSDDLLRLAISLDSVVNSVESLPMLSSVQATTDQTLAELTEEPAPATDPDTQDTSTVETASPQGFDQAWLTIKQVAQTVWYDIKSLIEVTKVDSPEVLMLSSRQETDLRNTLRLSLLNARISLLSRQATLLKSDLERSSNLLNTYFDDKSIQVQRAKTVLEEIGTVQLDLILPELQATSAALRLAVAGQQGERQ
ncbi:Bifunctional uroporphyrinogen-III synthetase/uroporphyrin-III C-methyltransferase [Limnobacter sp. 130]|uniref:uroporphyrinogen-III C-methyltransferase n=1 Tax=Limnobacter sp. 130 TaxID=2653147 RepID=UPI0012F1C48B|nr:uroporphyrinogen-III C-methyltransferase [Limnobacter sp. 130]VWX35778.1 Bifunctional uroporphyrinogen-III synthetase/uroporphyrin-III C-methyltransferase [Limnobacter sp. 130]